jgi:hypothetical protein
MHEAFDHFLLPLSADPVLLGQRQWVRHWLQLVGWPLPNRACVQIAFQIHRFGHTYFCRQHGHELRPLGPTQSSPPQSHFGEKVLRVLHR